MPTTKVGLVAYADDPEAIFRKVYPAADEGELDDPRWVTEGCDPTRLAMMRKVDADSLAAAAPMTGTP